MIRFINNLIDSFNNKPGGFSARKLSAFAGVMTSIAVTVLHSDSGNVTTLLLIWLSFSLLCMGLVTVAQLSQLRTGQTVTTENSETIIKKTTTNGEAA